MVLSCWLGLNHDSNLTHRAETSASPGKAPAAATLRAARDDVAWGAQPPAAVFWSRSVATPAFQRGLGLQFPSDQALWDKYHPELLCETAVHVNNDLETYENWAGCCMRHANRKKPNSGK